MLTNEGAKLYVGADPSSISCDLQYHQNRSLLLPVVCSLYVVDEAVAWRCRCALFVVRFGGLCNNKPRRTVCEVAQMPQKLHLWKMQGM